jgi:hypothetical protein
MTILYFGVATALRSHPPCTLCRVPRAGRTRSEPDRFHHRQPEREKRRKRGASIDPHGYDAGKKIKGKVWGTQLNEYAATRQSIWTKPETCRSREA